MTARTVLDAGGNENEWKKFKLSTMSNPFRLCCRLLYSVVPFTPTGFQGIKVFWCGSKQQRGDYVINDMNQSSWICSSQELPK